MHATRSACRNSALNVYARVYLASKNSQKLPNSLCIAFPRIARASSDSFCLDLRVCRESGHMHGRNTLNLAFLRILAVTVTGECITRYDCITQLISFNSLWSQFFPVQPGLQRQTPCRQRPLSLQSATSHSSARTSHSAPFQSAAQWHRPPPYTPWPEHSSGHTPATRKGIEDDSRGWSERGQRLRGRDQVKGKSGAENGMINEPRVTENDGGGDGARDDGK